MSVNKERVIVFERIDGDLVASFDKGFTPRTLEIRNRADFEDKIMDGAHFSVRVVDVTGGRRPSKMVVDIVREIIQGVESPLGDTFWIDPMQFVFIKADVKEGHHMWFVGPRGTGKTTLVGLLAKHFGDVPCVKVDGAAIINARSAFGSDGADRASTTFRKSKMVKFLDEVAKQPETGQLRGIVHVDEFSRMNGAGEGPWHPLLDDTGSFDLQTSGEEETLTVKVPPGVIFVLTDNEQGGGHVGVMPMDIALQDRLSRFELGYPSPEWEVPWLMRKTEIERRDASAIVEVANSLRGLATQQGFEVGGPSPRRTLMAAVYVKHGIARDLAIGHAIVDFYIGDGVGDDRYVVKEHLRSVKLFQDLTV